MSVNIIKYNDIEIGSPTPFVTLERSHVFNGQKLGNVDKIKLIGQLTGKYSDLTGYQQGLINKFNQNFKAFEIYEVTGNDFINLSKIYQKSGVIVNSINFSEGVYNGILKYEVDLVAKDFNYNVQNPVNQFTINKQNNTLTLNHNVSAQGVNTSSTNYSNSLDNAISFVNQFTGLNGIPNLYIEDNIGLPQSITILNA